MNIFTVRRETGQCPEYTWGSFVEITENQSSFVSYLNITDHYL